MTPSLLTIEETPEISLAVEAACARVPPLWPLQNFVAVNPFMHEPLRLQMFVEAPTDRINAVLHANPEVTGLVDNGWIHLMSMASGAIYERRGRANWVRMGGQGD